MGKIMYIWEDTDGNQRITSSKPEPQLSMLGAWLTPEYKKVVVIEVEDEH